MGCGHRKRVSTPSNSEWMEQRVAELARTADPANQQSGELLRETLRTSRDHEWLVHLDDSRCYWFTAAGDDSFDRISLSVVDTTRGTRTDSDRGSGAFPVVKHCPVEQGPFRIQVRASRGSGRIVVGIYTPSQSKEVGASPEQVSALIEKEASVVAPGALRSGELFVGSTPQSEWSVAMAPGTCYWLVGVGEPGRVKRLEITLTDPRQKRATESHTETNVAVVGHCPEQPGLFKIQAKVLNGSGTYKVGVYARKQ